MKVLITGAAGMLGSSLKRTLMSTSSFEILGLTRTDLDLRNRDQFQNILTDFKPDAVIHAAAKVGGIQANIASPVQFLADNLQMDTNVIMSCLRQGVGNFVYLGSSCMYPRDYRQPLVESDILKAPLEPTNEGYALAKISGSKLCEYASNSMSVNYKTIIPSNLYGPGDNFEPGSSHLLASVIRKVHEAKILGASKVDVWGSGEARREFTFINDLVLWLGGMLQSLDRLPARLNVGVGQDHSVNEFYRAALETLGVQAELLHDLTKPEGMKAKLMDSTLAKTEFGWDPKTDLSTGIELTYEWFLKRDESEH